MTTEDPLKSIRWRQRFQNLQKAATQLERGLAIDLPSEIEMQGIIQSFEFTFELSWKTSIDYGAFTRSLSRGYGLLLLVLSLLDCL